MATALIDCDATSSMAVQRRPPSVERQRPCSSVPITTTRASVNAGDSATACTVAVPTVDLPSCVQVRPASVERHTPPSTMPAKTIWSLVKFGETATACTESPVSPLLDGFQLRPPFVDRNTPSASLPRKAMRSVS